MSLTANHDKHSTAIRGVVTALTGMGVLCQTFAIPAMIAGAFVGPHLLIPAVAMFAVGSASMAAGYGVARGFRLAHIAGAVLAAALATTSVGWAAALTVQTEEPWPVRFFLGLMALALGAPFAVAVVTLVKTWPANRRHLHE